jgi:hypothetical protein
MAPSSYLAMAAFTANTVPHRSRKSTYGLPRRNAAWAMRAVSSGTGGSGCGRSDMGGLRMGNPLNAAAGPNAADFANSIRSFL